MKDIILALLSSVVFSSLISGIVSLIVVKQESINHLRSNRQIKRIDLSLKIFSELQNALKKIDEDFKDESFSNKNTFNDDLIDAIITMQKRADEKLKEIKMLIDQISYLIPENHVIELQEKINNIDHLKYSLMAFTYKNKGEDLVIEGIDNSINSDNFVDMVKQYINDVDNLINDFKQKIIILLRELCGT